MLQENNLITKSRDLSPLQQFWERKERYLVTHHDNLHLAKLASQGTTGIWVDFSGHPVGTYNMLNQMTQKLFAQKHDFSK